MLQSAKTTVRSKAAAATARLADVIGRTGEALREAALGLVAAPVLVPVRVRARPPGRTD